MQKDAWANAWFRHIAVAVAFAAGTSLFRAMIIPHWVLLCGFHLSVLLLVRYRYWPALLVGEAASLAHLSYAHFDALGPAWAILNLKPSILFLMPIAYLCREKWRLFPAKDSVNIGTLLAGSLLAAAAMTLNNLLLLLTAKLPPDYGPMHYGQVLSHWALGNYLGILTVVPIVLAVNQSARRYGWHALPIKTIESRLVLEGTFLLIPAMLLLIWAGHAISQAREIAQMAMFMPMVWLALRHGWMGAAIGGTAASFAVIALMPERSDVSTLQAEVVIAFAVTAMLLMGARIASLNQRADKERSDLRLALALAQRNVHMGEMQLRVTAQVLDQIRETVHSGYAMMMGRLKTLQPAINDRSYRLQALIAQDQLYRLADSLYPTALREHGLPATLNEGALSRVLNDSGITYHSEIQGPLSELSAAIHLAIYRITCEAVADACIRRDISAITVLVRCGRSQGRAWVMIRIDCHTQPHQAEQVRWNELIPKVVLRTTSGLGRQAIEDRAATFEGKARERALPDGRRISVILFDPILPGG
jgi:glucose-6-phosphate-specific signal transduction histidine kinase